MTAPKRIAIVGSGVAGLGAAYALKDTHEITLFEQDDRLGGHANTVRIDIDGAEVPVDTGFIVFNKPNYPNFTALLEHLGVGARKADMSFSFSAPGGLEWCSSLSGVFAQKRNIASPRFLGMLAEMARFNIQARRDLRFDRLRDMTLADYLRHRRFGETFQRAYLLPMSAAIWSATEDSMLSYPAVNFLKFFDNHRLLHVVRPGWWAVEGASGAYVSKIADALGPRVRRGRRITGVRRDAYGVELRDASHATERFDEVILACHSDQALALLDEPSEEERFFLGAIRYATNPAYLHLDPALMPTRRNAWASWNYRVPPHGGAASVTYDMTLLQALPVSRPVFVTLNPEREPDPNLTIAQFEYAHPQFDAAAAAAQRRFNTVQGVRRTWFCGAWLGYGFHEDGLRSGLRVAQRLGGRIPWTYVEGDIDGGRWGERDGDRATAAAVR